MKDEHTGFRIEVVKVDLSREKHALTARSLGEAVIDALDMADNISKTAMDAKIPPLCIDVFNGEGDLELRINLQPDEPLTPQ